MPCSAFAHYYWSRDDACFIAPCAFSDAPVLCRISQDQQEGAEEDADAELPQWRAFCVKRREDDDEPKHGFIPVTTQVLATPWRVQVGHSSLTSSVISVFQGVLTLNILVQAIGVAHQLRVTVGRKSGTSATNVSGEASGTESPTLRSTIEKITVSGFSMSASPQASKVISLLNLSSKLEGLQRYQDAVEVDILCGLALMNSRRHVQVSSCPDPPCLSHPTMTLPVRHAGCRNVSKSREQSPGSALPRR